MMDVNLELTDKIKKADIVIVKTEIDDVWCVWKNRVHVALIADCVVEQGWFIPTSVLPNILNSTYNVYVQGGKSKHLSNFSGDGERG